MLWRRSRNSSALFPCIGALVAVFLTPASLLAQKHTLAEPANDGRLFEVTVDVNVTGKLQTSTGDGKTASHDLKAEADLSYRERRLSGSGRDAAAFRSLRYYDKSNASIQVSGQSSYARLRENRKLVVAQGRRDGIEIYSPTGTMTYGELDLLRCPADSLSSLSLLPRLPVEVGDEWKPDSWAVQMIAGIDAVLDSDLKCRLATVEGNVARVDFEGKLKGAADGAGTSIQINGNYQFDLANNYVSRVELKQSEKRSVGTVSPGMEVTANVIVQRAMTNRVEPLSKTVADGIPLDPPAELLPLVFDSPWNVRFYYDRDWHIFHQTGEVAVLRLLDNGSLIAQCNVSPVAAAEPGQHTSEERFQADVRAALGDKLKSIESAEILRTDDDRFLYRVTAVGTSAEIDMHWFYYLCAGPTGKQIAFVFSVESELFDRFAGRDLSIVNSLQFLEPRRLSRNVSPEQ